MVVFKYKSGDIIGVSAVGFSITGESYRLIQVRGNAENVIDGNLDNVSSITIDGAKVYEEANE
ncbi:MAG: hypothetical protein ACRCU6_03495 [Fusobacteriaceae bacterium]